MHIPRRAIAGLTTLAATGAFAVATAPANAAPPTQCIEMNGDKYPHCPLNRASVPVYETPSFTKRVGTLNAGGLANWFKFQVVGTRVSDGRFSNIWWAYTRADRVDGKPGAWGYVPEVYFQGGGIHTQKPARGLRIKSIDVSVPSGQRP
jgi:hypothetical protein